jgi:extracellular elastinolytic metalloproteinase
MGRYVIFSKLITMESYDISHRTDFMATLVRSKTQYSDYPFGAWAKNRASGLRLYPYSLDKNVNPTRYGLLNNVLMWGTNHRIGQIWAQMLWNVGNELIAVHGFSTTLFPPEPDAHGRVPDGDFYRPRVSGRGPRIPKHGNTLMLQLVINGMKLLQCKPSFINGRDSILQADLVLTGGENYCAIWRGFAARGLGPRASLTLPTPIGGGYHKEDFNVPSSCGHTN